MSCCDTADTNVYGKEYIIALSLLLLVLSSAEIILGSLIYVFVLNIQAGAYWAGIVGFVTACIGLMPNNKCMVQFFIVMASISACIGIVGVVIDGGSAGFFSYGLTTCAQQDRVNILSGVKYYGSFDTNDKAASLQCAVRSIASTTVVASYCYCVRQVDTCDGFYNTYCNLITEPISQKKYGCYDPLRLNFPSQYNCGDMMSGPAVHYVQMLSGSGGLCGLIFLVSFILSILGCCGVCYAPPSYEKPNNNNNDAVVNTTV